MGLWQAVVTRGAVLDRHIEGFLGTARRLCAGPHLRVWLGHRGVAARGVFFRANLTFAFEGKSMQRNRTLAVLIAALMAVALAPLGAAASSHPLLPAFTQDELDNNWEPDRQPPSDGVTSLAAFDRADVARLGIDSTQTQANTFRRTEGIKTAGSDDFGQAVQVDLYIDPAWADTAVRAGFWAVGDDGAGERDNLFGIVEFVNLEPSTSGDSAQGDHEGWRIWDSSAGWTNLATEFSYGEWVTVGITLDTANQQYDFSIDGVQVGSGLGGEHFIREVFLNSYNYGLDEFPNLDNDSYAAHWHNGAPAGRDDCKDGGWQGFGFRNQGQCIKFVNTGMDSR